MDMACLSIHDILCLIMRMNPKSLNKRCKTHPLREMPMLSGKMYTMMYFALMVQKLHHSMYFHNLAKFALHVLLLIDFVGFVDIIDLISSLHPFHPSLVPFLTPFQAPPTP